MPETNEVSHGKLIFLPISVGSGLLAGLIGKKLFGVSGE